MSKIAGRAALEIPLGHSERMTLLAMVQYSTMEGEVWIGQDRLAEALGYSDRQVRRSLKALEESGHLTPTEPGGGRGKRTRYQINLPGFRAGEEKETRTHSPGIADEETRTLSRTHSPGKPNTRTETRTETRTRIRTQSPGIIPETGDTANILQHPAATKDLRIQGSTKIEEEEYPLIPHDSLVGKEWLRTAAQSFQEEYPLPCPWGEIRDQWEAFCTDPEALEKLMAILRAWKVSEKWRKKDGQYIPGARNYFLKGYATKWPPDRSLPGETGGDRVSDATRATRRNLQDYTPGSAFAALLRRAQGGDGPVDGDLGDGDQRDYGRYLPPGPGGRVG